LTGSHKVGLMGLVLSPSSTLYHQPRPKKKKEGDPGDANKLRKPK